MTIYMVTEYSYNRDCLVETKHYQHRKDAEEYMRSRVTATLSTDMELFLMDEYVDWSKYVTIYIGGFDLEPEPVRKLTITEIEVL